MKTLTLAVCAVVVSASAAYAQPYAGPYIGVEGGMDNYELSGDLDGDSIDPELEGYGAALDGLSGNGVVGGVFAGYHYGFAGGFVAVEGFGNLSDANMSASISDPGNSVRIEARAKETYGVAARFGTRANNSTGVYARVGWLNTKFVVTGEYDTVEDGSGGETYSQTEDAIQYGAGLETMVGPQMSLRVEYVFSDYGSAGLGEGISLDNNGIKAGVAYRF